VAGDVVQVVAGVDCGQLGGEGVNGGGGGDLPTGDGVNASGNEGENALFTVTGDACVQFYGADLPTGGKGAGCVGCLAIASDE
jgi:hypothetical protein